MKTSIIDEVVFSFIAIVFVIIFSIIAMQAYLGLKTVNIVKNVGLRGLLTMVWEGSGTNNVSTENR